MDRNGQHEYERVFRKTQEITLRGGSQRRTGGSLRKISGAELRSAPDPLTRNNQRICMQNLAGTIPPQKPTYFFAYIAKICRHICFGLLDWKNALKRNAEIVELTSEMQSCIPDSLTDIDRELESKEIGRLLNIFLSGLAQEKRLIFMRRYWYTDSIHSISQRYGISESKVKTTLFRTRNELEIFLRKEGITLWTVKT